MSQADEMINSVGWKWLQAQMQELLDAPDWPVVDVFEIKQFQLLENMCRCKKVVTAEWAQFTVTTLNWAVSEMIPRRAFESGVLACKKRMGDKAVSGR